MPFGVLLQYPSTPAQVVRLLRRWSMLAHARGAVAVVAADLLALTLLKPPGELGADIAVGNDPSASACRWASAARTPAT